MFKLILKGQSNHFCSTPHELWEVTQNKRHIPESFTSLTRDESCYHDAHAYDEYPVHFNNNYG